MNIPTAKTSCGIIIVRLFLFILLVYIFLIGVKLFGESIHLLGADYAKTLFQGLNNPFAGLAVGILATAIMQSSSATTSLVVTMVGAGQLPLQNAIPIIMGANIGTSITSTLISLGNIGNRAAFQRSFAGATVHDNFNILTVCVLLPVELITRYYFGAGILESSALWLTDFISGSSGISADAAVSAGSVASSAGVTAKNIASFNPVGAAVSPVANLLCYLLGNFSFLIGPWRALPVIISSLFLLLASLVLITKNMKVLMADKMEAWLNRVLTKRGYVGIIIGTIMTMAVQSSSITTSLLVPMYAAGMLKIRSAFPLLIGANIGTTITGLIASSVSDSSLGVTIALVHTLFNIFGLLIFYPLPFMREIPVRLSETLAELATKNKMWVFAYIGTVFFIAPSLGIFMYRGSAQKEEPVHQESSVHRMEESTTSVLDPSAVISSGTVLPEKGADTLHHPTVVPSHPEQETRMEAILTNEHTQVVPLHPEQETLAVVSHTHQQAPNQDFSSDTK